MSKLELKYLTPYLPYKLKCEILNYKCDYVGEKYGVINGFYYLGGEVHYTFKDRSTAGKTRKLIKPILRPISDLTEKQFNEFSLSDMITHGFHNVFWQEENFSVNHLMYHDLEILLKNHFDVFGLIEKGLAIDINKIK
jgi:hypothetical protein